MASTRWYPHAMSVNETYFSGIRGYSHNGNTERSLEYHDGEVDPSYVATLDSKPDLSVRTVDIAGLLAAVQFDGLVLTELTAWWKKGADCGTRAGSAATVHAKSVATSGCAVMRALRASHNQVVEAEVQAFLKSSNGLTDPWTWSFGAALAGAIADVDHFTLGPVFVTPSGGSRTQITVSDWEVDPGITVDPESHDGVPFPTFIGISKRAPKASLTTPDLDHTATVNMNGVVGSIELFLRKLNEGGTGGRVANATEEHIKLTLADGLLITETASAETDSESSASMVFDGTRDGTDPILEIEFDVAIA